MRFRHRTTRTGLAQAVFAPARWAAGLLALTLVLASCGGDAFEEGQGGGEGGKGTLTVGSAGFTESQLMAEMYTLLLEKAGYSTEIKTVENREIYGPALEKGQIDVVPEYAATMAEYLNLDENGPNAKPVASSDVDETMAALRELAEPRGLEALEPAEAVDQNAFAVTKEFAQQNGLETMSDFGAKIDKPIVLAATEECPERPYCEPGLEQTYGIEISEIKPLGFDTPQTNEAVTAGDAQMGLVATTDGTLGDDGLVVLEDDQNLQNADNLVPVVNADSAGNATVAKALNALSPVLTTEDLATLNRKVDVERLEAEDVARDYLKSKGLL
jgi:osmoprotectant transport system substrate-binding protein